MKQLAWVLAIGALVGMTAPAQAKKKKKTVATSAEVVKPPVNDANLPPPGDKRTNVGAQGRINATEGAAQDADSPQFDHRP